MNIEEKVIFDYLVNNLTYRQICKKYKEIEDPLGFKSFNIIKKYRLNDYKGHLFLLTQTDAVKTVRKVLEVGAQALLDIDSAQRFSKYKDTYIKAKDNDKAYSVLNGELRNLIQRFFDQRKKSVGVCQFKECQETRLQAAHHHNHTRREVFEEAANNNRQFVDGYYIYDVFNLIIDFLNGHKKPGKIIFLCAEHHKKYDNTDEPQSFLDYLE